MLSTFKVVPSSLARRRGRCRAGGARGVSAPRGAAPARRASRGRRVANMAHTRQSRPDSGLDSQVIKVLTTFKVSPPRPRAGVGAAGLGALVDSRGPGGRGGGAPRVYELYRAPAAASSERPQISSGRVCMMTFRLNAKLRLLTPQAWALQRWGLQGGGRTSRHSRRRPRSSCLPRPTGGSAWGVCRGWNGSSRGIKWRLWLMTSGGKPSILDPAKPS